MATARDTRVLHPTASNSAAPETLYPMRPIHQCHTRSNKPLTIFEEDKEPDKPSTTTNTTTPGQFPLQATIPPYDPCVQEMLDQPQQATGAIHDLHPYCRAALTATPTTRLVQGASPPRPSPHHSYQQASQPKTPPYRQAQHTSNPITTSKMITATIGPIPRPSHVMPFNSCLLPALPILPFRHSTT